VKVYEIVEQPEEMAARILTRFFEIARKDSEQEAEGCLWVTLGVMFSSQFVKTDLEIVFYAVLVTVKNTEHYKFIYALSSDYVIKQFRVLTDAADPNAQAIWHQNFLLRSNLTVPSANNLFEHFYELWLHLWVTNSLEESLLLLH